MHMLRSRTPDFPFITKLCETLAANEMTLQQLANKEDELYTKALSLYQQPQTAESHKQLKEIFAQYKQVHQAYARLAAHDVEALKRGLFLQWYAFTEPNYLTGISDLDKEAENRIIEALNSHIETSQVDPELVWMLNHYSHWDWVFQRVEAFNGFAPTVVNERNNQLPKNIDREHMSQRGQMGDYWNSLT
jgi:hypothetical protein